MSAKERGVFRQCSDCRRSRVPASEKSSGLFPRRTVPCKRALLEPGTSHQLVTGRTEDNCWSDKWNWNSVIFFLKTGWFLLRMAIVSLPFAHLYFNNLTIPNFVIAVMGTPILLGLLFNLSAGNTRTFTAQEISDTREKRRKYWRKVHQDDDDEQLRKSLYGDD